MEFKILICVFLYCIAYVTGETLDDFRKANNEAETECLSIYKISSDDLVQYALISSDTESLPEVYLCFIKCVYDKLGFISNQALSKQGLSRFVDVGLQTEDVINVVYNKCSQKVPIIDTCYKAMLVNNCFIAEILIANNSKI